MKEFIQYIQYSQGATAEEALELWNEIHLLMEKGETLSSILHKFDLSPELSDLF